MNIMNRVTWRAMWQNRTRTLVTIVGIILSAAMFTAVTTLGVSLLNYMIDAEMHNTGDYFIQYDYASDEDLESLRQQESVSSLGDLKALGYTTFESLTDESFRAETCIVAAGDDAFFHMVATHLEEGQLPQTSSQIVIPRSVSDFLQESGIPCDIGDILTLEIVPEYPSSPIPLPSKGGIAFTQHYEIVGISDYYQAFDDIDLNLNHLLTYADGSEKALWHRFFVKTDPANAAYDLKELSYGASSLNYNLLQLMGGNKYRNFDTVIQNFCIMLMGIIMIGSISLIYNAFSISVSERTKQFGLLSSIGATRKQLRRSVYFEALSLCAISIPLGILFGYLGIAATLYLTHDIIESFLWSASENGVFLKAVPSIAAFVAAGAISLVTVLISCRIPAGRATKIAPISAIRQTQEYDASKANVKVGKQTAKLFGLPGILAKKYYTVSKKKYRSTVFSITISVVLFITAFSFTNELQGIVQQNANTYNYDMDIYFSTQEELAQLRAQPFVAESALVQDTPFYSYIPDNAFSDEYVTLWNEAIENGNASNHIDAKRTRVYYLEDAVFRAYLDAHKIDPAPYFDAKTPTALVSAADIMIYSTDESGNPTRVSHHENVFLDDAATIDLYPVALPAQVDDFILKMSNSHYLELSSYDGMLVISFYFDESDLSEFSKSQPFLMEDNSLHIAIRREKQDGIITDGYYLLNPVTREMDSKPLAETTSPDTEFCMHLGAAIDELPFGIPTGSNENTIALILPLSMANPETALPQLAIKTTDYQGTLNFLEENELTYADYLSFQMDFRNYITIINIFCYGFIVLISLICVCNVFNTISTNIALRRKDFGMLRSIGMKNSELYRMMSFECLQYGLKAMLFGFPLSLAASVGIHQIARDVSAGLYQPPIAAILIAACCVFLVVFITMYYAVTKLKKDNPIEAIRMESV